MKCNEVNYDYSSRSNDGHLLTSRILEGWSRELWVCSASVTTIDLKKHFPHLLSLVKETESPTSSQFHLLLIMLLVLPQNSSISHEILAGKLPPNIA